MKKAREVKTGTTKAKSIIGTTVICSLPVTLLIWAVVFLKAGNENPGLEPEVPISVPMFDWRFKDVNWKSEKTQMDQALLMIRTD